MPDGPMSPEKSTIEQMRQLGAVPGAAKPETQPQTKGVYGSAEQKWQEQARAGTISPSVEQSRRIVNQEKGDDDRDPNKDRLEHEMRMQEMYGEGKAAYMGSFIRGVSELTFNEKDTRKLDEKIMFVRMNKARLSRSGDRVSLEKSQTVQDARNTLKTELEELRQLVEQNAGQKITFRTKKGEVDAIQVANRELATGAELLINEPIERERSLEESREKIAEAYVNIMHSSLDEIAALNKYLENLKNPYPYDSRWALQFFEQALERVTDKLRNKDKLGEESKALLKMLKRDILWSFSDARVVEAMGPAFEVYFDGELMLQWVRTPHTELVAQDFVRLNQKTLKGANLNDQERNLVKKTLGKRAETIVATTENGKQVERLGLREVAIDYQDSYIKWLYTGIAVGQKNLDIFDPKTWKEVDKDREEGEHYAVIKDPATYRFMMEFLALDDSGDIEYINKDGVKFKIKEKLLNPFCMPRNDELANQAFMTRMHELVVQDAKIEEVLGKIRKELEDAKSFELTPDQEKRIKDLSSDLLKSAQLRIDKWEALDEESIYSRLADGVIKSVTNIEKGVLASGDLGWTWQYEKDISLKIETDAKGEYVVKDGGKIYKKDIDPMEWKDLAGKFALSGDGVKLVENINKIVTITVGSDTFGEYVQMGPDKKYKKDLEDDEWKKLSSLDGASYVVRRKSEMGSIYENHDVTTVAFMAKHIMEYDTLADTRGTGVWVFPTIGWYRELWDSQPPYWRPRIEALAKNDTLLLRRLGLGASGEIVPGGLLSENNPIENREARKVMAKGKQGVQIQTYGKLDRRVRDFIRDNMWAYVTPFVSEPGKGGGEDYLVMPIFTPTSFDLNFYKGVSLDKPSAKTSDGKSVSIFKRRLQGVKNSELNWENMDKYKYSWIRVTHDQLERILGPIVTPHEFNRSTAPEYEKHYDMPSGKSDKEAGKRARLGGRMFSYVDGVLRSASLGQNKILSTVPESGIMGANPANDRDLEAEVTAWMSKWVAPWVNASLDMPGKVRKIYNYQGTTAQIQVFSFTQIKRIVVSAIKHAQGQVSDVSKSISSIGSAF